MNIFLFGPFYAFSHLYVHPGARGLCCQGRKLSFRSFRSSALLSSYFFSSLLFCSRRSSDEEASKRAIDFALIEKLAQDEARKKLQLQEEKKKRRVGPDVEGPHMSLIFPHLPVSACPLRASTLKDVHEYISCIHVGRGGVPVHDVCASAVWSGPREVLHSLSLTSRLHTPCHQCLANQRPPRISCRCIQYICRHIQREAYINLGLPAWPRRRAESGEALVTLRRSLIHAETCGYACTRLSGSAAVHV